MSIGVFAMIGSDVVNNVVLKINRSRRPISALFHPIATGHFDADFSGHFDADSGGHFDAEFGGHFAADLGGHFTRNLQYSRDEGNMLIDCDTKNGLTLEVTPDTTLLFTNHVAQVSAEYRNPDVLHGQFQARLYPDQAEAMVIADDGGEILNTITGRPVMQTHFASGSLYSELQNGIRTFSTKFSSIGDLLVSQGPNKAGVILRPDLLLSRSPVFDEVDLFSFYGFTVDDAVAFLTKSGEYVVTDKNMRVDRRYRLSEDTSMQRWASLCSASKQLIVSYDEDRIEIYDVSSPVSVGSENSTKTPKQNVLWPSHSPLILSGSITSVYDALGRDQMNHFYMTTTGDNTVLLNEGWLKGLFFVVMSSGEVCAVLCE